MTAATRVPAAARFAAACAALSAAHDLADFLVQRDTDATAKGDPWPTGAAACARHVASYAATQAVALYAADRYLHLGLNRHRAAAGLALSAGSHYLIDRCYGHWADTGPDAPLLVRAMHKAGKKGWLTRDPTAGPIIDQASHRVWIAVAAAVAGSGQRP